jgi:hypothetical protein
MKPLLLALALLATLPVLAQTLTRSAQVYRCGPEGRDLRDSPCPGSGAASSVEFDEPSAADSRAARDRHLADSRQAAALAQARRASEAEARQMRARAVGLQAPPAPPQPASAPQVVQLKPPKTAKPHKPSSAASHPR